jgi:enamine deaminase RidA (YjgF/YER057c/UK114 family)
MAKLTFSNPAGVPAPASRYSQSVLIEGAARRLVISGQVGVRPDGSLAGGAEAQIEQALANLGTVLAVHHMAPQQVAKVTVLLTDRALVGAWRSRRDAFFGEHAPTSTLIVVAGLAHPDYEVEVEAEAIG